jgi:hypothetical protein
MNLNLVSREKKIKIKKESRCLGLFYYLQQEECITYHILLDQ